MIPSWIKDAVFYQIFPDRFANGDPSNDPSNVQPWGSKPTTKGFQGGDLKGIMDRFDYLLDLGINAIYLNPIFQATSNHRYNTANYYKIDNKLGKFEDFQAFLDHAHGSDVRVILDGVFNHCGRSFFAFQDLLENEQYSAYRDWFHIHRFPLEAYGTDAAKNYTAWWDFKSLPKFNTSNPEVRNYLIGVAKYWLDQGIDGWRLDVPNEIDDDSFWAEFRQVVKGANPDAYLVGEIWEANPRWVGDDHFDGLMCYPLRDLLLDLIVEKKINVSKFAAQAEELFNLYPKSHYHGQMLTLGSHDTKRLLTICKGNRSWVQLICTLQFCMPGAPHIYYGDEVGLEGGEDPDCRKAFPWDENEWDREHFEFMRRLIDIRAQYAQLRGGQLIRIAEDDKRGVLTFMRRLEDQAVLILANTRNSTVRVTLPFKDLPFPKGVELQDVLNGSEIRRYEGSLEINLKPLQGAIVVPVVRPA